MRKKHYYLISILRGDNMIDKDEEKDYEKYPRILIKGKILKSPNIDLF